MKILKILLLVGISILLNSSSCDKEEPNTSSTRTMTFNFILQGNPDCVLSFNANTDIQIEISDLEHNMLSNTSYSGTSVSPGGQLNVQVPISGDFAIAVFISGGCQSCCDCTSSTYGNPLFFGSQDQAFKRDTYIDVYVRFQRCSDCGCN